MEVNAKLRFLRMSPRKVRLVVDLIRGKKVQAALDQLQFSGKVSATPVTKLVKSAIANAVNNFSLSADNLIIKEISVGQGPTLKRWTPKAHGRATPIMKRTSHINITLAEIKDSGVREGKKTELVAPVKLSGAPIENEGMKVADKDEDAGKAPEIKAGHSGKVEGGKKGFTKKMFARKSG